MNALLTIPAAYIAVEERRPVATAKPRVATVRNVALLVAAPFIGLVYVLAFPFVGLVLLAWLGFRALPKRVKNIVLFFAAPFIALAYVVVFPFVGLGILVWTGARAAAK